MTKGARHFRGLLSVKSKMRDSNMFSIQRPWKDKTKLRWNA